MDDAVRKPANQLERDHSRRRRVCECVLGRHGTPEHTERRRKSPKLRHCEIAIQSGESKHHHDYSLNRRITSWATESSARFSHGELVLVTLTRRLVFGWQV